jgi:small subunit ribosomal protein S10
MPTTHTTKKETHPKPTTAKTSTPIEKVPMPVVKQARVRTKKVVPEVAELPKLRIRIRAYEHKILDASLKQIMDTAARYDAEFFGPVPLPTEIKKYTVNRSSFVHKNAREQFEMRVHKRLVDIINPNPKVIDALTNLSLPSGVNIEVKMM